MMSHSGSSSKYAINTDKGSEHLLLEIACLLEVLVDSCERHHLAFSLCIWRSASPCVDAMPEIQQLSRTEPANECKIRL